VLLTSGVVHRLAQESPRRLAEALEGVQLASRQVSAQLRAMSHTAPARDILSAATGIPPAMHDALGTLATSKKIHLDRIDVQAGPVEDFTWHAGLLLQPQVRVRAARPVRVAIIEEIALKPRTDARLRLQHAGTSDDAEVERLRADIIGRGIGLLVVRKTIMDDLMQRLLQDGIAVLCNATNSLVHRIQRTTGAVPTHHLHHLGAANLGAGTLQPGPLREGHWNLLGAGPTATIRVPAGPQQNHRIEAVQRWLRLSAHVQELPEALAGAGRWQREMADKLEAIAELAPGAKPIGIRAVARTLHAIADCLARNAGLDPLDRPALPAHLDATAAVLEAVRGGLDLAIALIRIDARHTKRPSQAVDMRGGAGPSGSPKGMPGDIPPLM
jgi:hypothetical protein